MLSLVAPARNPLNYFEILIKFHFNYYSFLIVILKRTVIFLQMEKTKKKSSYFVLLVLIFLILFLNKSAVAYSSSDQAQEKAEVYYTQTDEQVPRSIISLNGTWEFDQTLNYSRPGET